MEAYLKQRRCVVCDEDASDSPTCIQCSQPCHGVPPCCVELLEDGDVASLILCAHCASVQEEMMSIGSLIHDIHNQFFTLSGSSVAGKTLSDDEEIDDEVEDANQTIGKKTKSKLYSFSPIIISQFSQLPSICQRGQVHVQEMWSKACREGMER